jgi:hypothetical protein
MAGELLGPAEILDIFPRDSDCNPLSVLAVCETDGLTNNYRLLKVDANGRLMVDTELTVAVDNLTIENVKVAGINQTAGVNQRYIKVFDDGRVDTRDLKNLQDSVLIYGHDGLTNTQISVDHKGHLSIVSAFDGLSIHVMAQDAITGNQVNIQSHTNQLGVALHDNQGNAYTALNPLPVDTEINVDIEALTYAKDSVEVYGHDGITNRRIKLGTDGKAQIQLYDQNGAAYTALNPLPVDTEIDVNIEPLAYTKDSVLIYGFDGVTSTRIATDAMGYVQISSTNGLTVMNHAKLTKTIATGSGVINTTTALTTDFRLDHISLHLSTPSSDGLTISLDSGDTAPYDTVLKSQALSSTTDLLWVPDYKLSFVSGDNIKVAFSNSTGSTFGLIIVTEEI